MDTSFADKYKWEWNKTRILPKCNHSRVRHLQSNPKHACYNQILKRERVRDQNLRKIISKLFLLGDRKGLGSYGQCIVVFEETGRTDISMRQKEKLEFTMVHGNVHMTDAHKVKTASFPSHYTHVSAWG